MVQICILINTRDIGGKTSLIIGIVLNHGHVFLKSRGGILGLIKMEIYGRRGDGEG